MRIDRSSAAPRNASEPESLAGAPEAFEAQRGAARVVVVLGVVLLLALAWLLVANLGERVRDGAASGGIAPSRATGSIDADVEDGSAPLEIVRRFERDEGGLVGGPTPTPASWKPDFDGKGSLRGRVLVPAGIEVSALRVSARPSRILRGRDHARAAEVTLAAGVTEFELRDLPLGGYDVEVEGEGLHGAPQPVLLVKGSADPYVTLAVHQTGFIDGHVQHADGRPAEGVEVSLEPLAGGARRSTTTSAAGVYSFDDVRDGEYRIRFGPLDQPLLPERELSFRAPSMQFTPQVLLALVELRLVVVDLDGQRVAGATIDGYGSRGGQVHATTDFVGEARIGSLPPGKYRISAHDAEGRRGRLELELGPDGPTEHVLRLRP